MKYILVLCFISLVSIGKGQVPPHGGMPYPDPMQPIPRDTGKPCTRCWPKIKDTPPPSFHDIVFLMQQNMELSQHIDRLENRNDSLLSAVDELHHELSSLWEITKYNATYSTRWEDSLERKINSLDRRPYLFIDVKCSRPGVWLTNSKGEYQIFITSINYK